MRPKAIKISLTLVLSGLLVACGELLPALGLDGPGSSALIAASHSLVGAGDTVTVAWDVADADHAVLVTSGATMESRRVSLAGVLQVQVTQDTVFTVSARDQAGGVLASGTVLVGVANQAPDATGEDPVVTDSWSADLLGASRLLVPPGGEVELRWLASAVTGARAATLTIDDERGRLSSEAVALDGSRRFMPESDSVISLIVTGAGGVEIAGSTIRIEQSLPFEALELNLSFEVEPGWFEQRLTLDASHSSNMELADSITWDFGDGQSRTTYPGDADFLGPSH